MSRFKSVLVANRGEIAVRVLRSVKAQGLRAIAVYSSADADAPHVKLADTAICIGEPPSAQSYLVIERILEAAKRSGAGAIHPGYGFLSENARFARAVEDAGLVFIGPPASAIEIMGDKAVSKRAMIDAGVPCIPGYQGEDQSDSRLRSEAERIGYPLMVKASAGGGGRGMRLVGSADHLPAALAQARAEAESAFGSSDLILEKALIEARHVEIQVFADESGNTVHLGERDCSIQRRHQKVLEESPCPVMTPGLRARMGASAVEAARAVNYRGAGTVEFLLDARGQFYFLEMNTRLQVEHPVTEMVTGLDLVALQLSVAQGHDLPLDQDQLEIRGHAIEARLYAEDPCNEFLPSTGTVTLWSPPGGDLVRCDAGIETGFALTPFYDPLVAKIIVHGKDRVDAVERLGRALADTTLLGVRNNRRFLMSVLAHPTFGSGEATTSFVDEVFAQPIPDYKAGLKVLAAAATLRQELESRKCRTRSTGIPDELMGWSSSGILETSCTLPDGSEASVRQERVGSYLLDLGGAELRIRTHRLSADEAELIVEGDEIRFRFVEDADGRIELSLPDGGQFAILDPSSEAAVSDATAGGTQVIAPMHGVLFALMVAPGESVEQGRVLAVVEAMKMQHNVAAERGGIVEQIFVEEGAQLSARDVILSIQPIDAP